MSPLGDEPPPSVATDEFWKQVAAAAVEQAKTELADAYADSRATATRASTYQKTVDAGLAARRKAEWDTELEVHKQVLTAMIEVAKGSIERSRDSAKFVQTVSAALATAYTAALGLVFAVKDNPLPARGFIPTIFLGLAAALSTAYLAFLIKSEGTPTIPGSDLPRENAVRKVGLLINWTGATVYNRAPLLRGSVVALLLAVGFLPVAVLKFSQPETLALSAVAAEAPSTPPVAPTSSSPTSSLAPSTPPSSASSTGPSPSPTWPLPPTDVGSEELTIELYKAQLVAHVEALKTPAAAPAAKADDSAAEDISWRLAGIGVLVVVLVTVTPFLWRRRPGAHATTTAGES